MNNVEALKAFAMNIAFTFAISYLICAFLEASLNITDWYPFVRFVCLVVATLSAMIVTDLYKNVK